MALCFAHALSAISYMPTQALAAYSSERSRQPARHTLIDGRIRVRDGTRTAGMTPGDETAYPVPEQ
jgi:hypothetical protein